MPQPSYDRGAGPSGARRPGAAQLASTLVALVLLVVASACEGPARISFDPDHPEITAARGTARVANADVLAQLTGTTPTLASARIDSCVRGADTWTRRDSWTLRCHYRTATALQVSDLSVAARDLGRSLESLGCADPSRMTRLLEHWGEINPGEPGPSADDFRPGVFPDQVLDCGAVEIWTRISSADDPLLDLTAVDAASTQDPVVVSARPFTVDEVTAMAQGSPPPTAVIFLTVVSLYHEQER